MAGKVALVLLFFNLDGSHVQALQEVPFFRARAFLEEVEQDDIVELQALRFIDGQAKRMLQHRWNLRLAFLVSHNNDLVAAELKRRLLETALAFCFVLLSSAQHIKEQLLVG